LITDEAFSVIKETELQGFPSSIYIGSENIYVTDLFSASIWVLDEDGNITQKLSFKDSGFATSVRCKGGSCFTTIWDTKADNLFIFDENTLTIGGSVNLSGPAQDVVIVK